MKWLLLLLLWPATASAAWDRYELIIWQDQTPERLAVLKQAGFTGAKLNGNGGIDAGALARYRASGLSYYLENIATDFYAPYHRWTAGKQVTWLFDAAKAALHANPGNTDPFRRVPGLEDPAWRQRVATRLTAVAQAQAQDHPLFYSLGDETGIGDLAAAWDADVSPASVTAFQLWLRTQYTDLAALNAQWGTHYSAWEGIEPELTDAALARTDGNYSAWSDFKAFMDVSFARAVRMGTDAVHRGDPAARAAIEGAQIPGWGGYDYGVLAPAVDVMEIYDSGQALAIARSVNPAMIPLRTSFVAGVAERHAAWSSFLGGVRGTIVWDEDDSIVAADGTLSPRAKAMGAQQAELQALAPLLWAARPHPSGVAVLASQASFRLRWLLDRQVGPRWSDRDAERENEGNAWRGAREQMAERLAALGVTPQWVTSLDAGVPPGVTTVMLPQVLALSDNERAALAQVPVVLADTEPGAFDGHGRRATPLPIPTLVAIRPAYGAASSADLDAVRAALAVPTPVRVTEAGGTATGIVLQLFDHRDGLIVAVQTVAPGLTPRTLTLSWSGQPVVRNVRSGITPGRTDHMTIILDPIDPTILLLQP